MKIFNQLLALGVFCANLSATIAFTAPTGASRKVSPVVLTSVQDRGSSGGETNTNSFEMFPIYPELETVQGGGTVKTFKMPEWTERCQLRVESFGRPMRCTIELWIGPIRKVHTVIMDVEDGRETPYEATIKFKKLAPVLRFTTDATHEFPIKVGVSVPSKERANELADNTDAVWEAATPSQKLIIQGGSTIDGKGGSIRTWTIPENVQSVQIVSWAKDVSKKSFRHQVELLHGPNNIKQSYTLQCGGGTQPYHAVFQTPGVGWMIRIKNLKFVEDGLNQLAVVPYDVIGGPQRVLSPAAKSDVQEKEWWQR